MNEVTSIRIKNIIKLSNNIGWHSFYVNYRESGIISFDYREEPINLVIDLESCTGKMEVYDSVVELSEQNFHNKLLKIEKDLIVLMKQRLKNKLALKKARKEDKKIEKMLVKVLNDESK